jgi:hypothetical protein
MIKIELLAKTVLIINFDPTTDEEMVLTKGFTVVADDPDVMKEIQGDPLHPRITQGSVATYLHVIANGLAAAIQQSELAGWNDRETIMERFMTEVRQALDEKCTYREVRTKGDKPSQN